MKKIDIKARMEEKVRSTEWTDSNTWNVLDRIRKAKSAPRFRWSPALLPAAAVLVLVVCLGVTSVFGPKGGPDQIRNHNLHTLQPVTTSLSQGDGQEGEGPASPDTVLYYNPDGGSKYHLDPNCLSVLPKYQPLEGQFTYAEVNDEQYSSLEPCRICNAPERNPDTSGDLPAADSAEQADTEADAVTMGQVDEAVAEATRQALRDKYPGWAEQLIPLNVSCENQGIRLEVLGALVKGNDSTLLCALQDLEGDRINGYPIEWTNLVPSNLTKGTSSSKCSAMVFGNFEDLYIGHWGGIDVVVDPFTLAENGDVRIVLNSWDDCVVAEPKSFAAVVDLTTNA